MGIFNKDDGGISCEPVDETGNTLHCRVFKNGKNEKLATGSDWTINVSPENNCEPIMVGRRDIIEGDEDKINRVTESARKACRRGFV